MFLTKSQDWVFGVGYEGKPTFLPPCKLYQHMKAMLSGWVPIKSSIQFTQCLTRCFEDIHKQDDYCGILLSVLPRVTKWCTSGTGESKYLSWLVAMVSLKRVIPHWHLKACLYLYLWGNWLCSAHLKTSVKCVKKKKIMHHMKRLHELARRKESLVTSLS